MSRTYKFPLLLNSFFIFISLKLLLFLYCSLKLFSYLLIYSLIFLLNYCFFFIVLLYDRVEKEEKVIEKEKGEDPSYK